MLIRILFFLCATHHLNAQFLFVDNFSFETQGENIVIKRNAPALILNSVNDGDLGIFDFFPSDNVTRLISAAPNGLELRTDFGPLEFKTGFSTQGVMNQNGKFGFGTLFPQEKVHIVGNTRISGDLKVSGAITGVSDARIKKDLSPIHNAIGILRQLKPVSYTFRTDEFPELKLSSTVRLGLLAQDVQKVLPQLVTADTFHTVDGGELLSVNYIELIPLLIQANKDLVEQNLGMLERISRLEHTILQLKD